MNYLLVALSMVTLIVVIMNFKKMHVQQEQMSQKIANFNTEITEMKETHQVHLQTYEKVSKQAVSQYLEEITTSVRKEVNQIQEEGTVILKQAVKQYEDLLLEKLQVYLHEEEKEIELWMEKATLAKSPNEKVQILETAINKYPMIPSLVHAYKDILKSLLPNVDDRTKKQMIEKLNHAARVHLDNSKPNDWLSAKAFKDETLRLGNEYMSKQERIFIEKTNNTLQQLEKLVPLHFTDQVLKEMEELDESIDKNIIKHYPEIFAHYQALTSQLIKKMNKEPSQEQIKEYNKKAIQTFKRAQSSFTQLESFYKKGEKLEELTRELGGWQPSYFSMPTQIYFQNVYSDIFAKLSPTAKPRLTELMLNTPMKKVGS